MNKTLPAKLASLLPSKRSIFNYANVVKGRGYHQFNATQSGETPVNTNEIALSTQPRDVLFASNYTAGFDNAFDWLTAFNDAILPVDRNASAVNGNDSLGPAEIDLARLPIIIDAANPAGDVYQIFSNNTLKMPNSGITYVEKMSLFQPENSAAGATTFRIRSWNNGTATTIDQADWNIDTFGAGALNPSSITLDWTFNQAVVLEISNRDHGKLRVGFLVGNTIYFAHEFQSNNTMNGLPYGNLNLPIADYASRFATGVIRGVGLFDGISGVTFEAVTDTTTTPTALLQYYDYSTVAYTIGADPVEETKRIFSAEGERSLGNALPTATILAVRPKSKVFGLNNKATYSADLITFSASGNAGEGAEIDIWWNVSFGGGSFSDISFYSLLESSSNSNNPDLTNAIRIGGIRINNGENVSVSIKDFINDYENSFSTKHVTFNGVPLENQTRGVICFIGTRFGSGTSTISADMSGGEIP